MFKKLLQNKQLLIMLVIVLIIITFFGVQGFINSSGGRTSAEKYKVQGDKYYDTTDFRNALNFYNMALEAEPAYEEVYIILYEHYIEAGEKLSAWEVIRAGVENTDNDMIYELYTDADYPVEFPEEFIEYLKDNSLWYNEGLSHIEYRLDFNKTIMRSELDMIENISLYNNYTTSGWYNGQFVSAYEVKFDNLEFLAHFKNLSSLQISGVGIGDFSAVKEFKNLVDFNIYNSKNSIKISFDLSVLENLPKLQSLGLSGVEVINLSVLENCSELKFLNLNTIEITELSFIKKLTKLEGLFLSGVENLDLSLFSSLTELNTLSIYNCGVIEDLSLLAELPNLLYFTAYNTEIHSFSSFEEAGFENTIRGYDDGSFIYFHHAQRQQEYFKRMNSEGWNIYYD